MTLEDLVLLLLEAACWETVAPTDEARKARVLFLIAHVPLVFP